MSPVIIARLPHRTERKLADYCSRQGVTPSEAVIRALDRYLDERGGGTRASSLAVGLIPRRGAKGLQSNNLRWLAQRAFRASLSR